MVLKPGFENKRQVYLLAALGAIILVAGSYEIYKSFPGSPAPTQPAPVATSRPLAQSASGQATTDSASALDAEKLASISNTGLDPTLHLAKLILAEQVQYAGTNRNIFSADSQPFIPPTPIRPARPNTVSVASNLPPQPPPKPQPPAIDLKYFGYTQSPDKSLKAFFVRGDDIFMARNGDIVDHRYKVDAITPGSVQVTDLSFKNTQSLPLLAN